MAGPRSARHARSERLAHSVLSATRRASRSPWVWTPAAVGGVGMATATVALGRLLTTPPQLLRQQAPMTMRAALLAPDRLVLSGPGAGAPGRWGVEYPGGTGEVGPVDAAASAARSGGVERGFRLLSGSAPAGTVHARLHAHVWPDLAAFTADTGIAGQDVTVRGETGPLPAWVFPAGDGRCWALLVHGRGAPRAQMLRQVPTLHALGITAMVISYRNDFAECRDPKDRMHFGHREWVDLEAALVAAEARGATEFVLSGMSMGGGIVKTLLGRSDHAGKVVAKVLDAPALNWGPILRHCARSRRVPSWLVPGVMTAAAWQARIDWRALNHLASPRELTRPVLLIHGELDPVVPVELSDAYAAAAPHMVTYLRVPAAGHVSSWNTDPEAYQSALRTFLLRRVGGPLAA